MATAGDMLNILVERIRADGTVAHTQAVQLALLSKCQQLLNIHSQAYTATETISTVSRQVIYDLHTLVPYAQDILEIDFEGRRLASVPNVRQIVEFAGVHWFREMAAEPSCWCQVGRGQLIVWPGCDGVRSLTVRYVKISTTLSATTTDLSVPQYKVPSLLKYAELVLLLRQRSVEEAGLLLKEMEGVKK